MPQWLWWTLAASVFVALFISVFVYFRTRIKINKVKNEYLADMQKHIPKETSKAFERENHGQLLWDLKEKTKKPLSDDVLEFIINTMVRNGYKKFTMIKGSEYEKESLVKLANAKESKTQIDFGLIFLNEDISTQFKEVYNKLKDGGMVAIVNAPKKDKLTKEIVVGLKSSKIRYDFIKIDKGVILAVK